MQPERLPFAKVFDTPFISLDETSIEMSAILFVFLAAIVITNVQRHRQLVRRLVQLASFAVFFVFIYSCLGVFGMIRNGLYGLTLIGSVYSESFYWMALPTVVIASALLCGPVFCGWICPTGAIQEFSGLLGRALGLHRLRSTRRRLIALGLALAASCALVAWVGREKQMFVEDSSLHWAAALLLLCYLVVLGVIDDLPTRRLRAVSVIAIVVTAISHVTITSPVHFAFTSRSDPASALSTLVIALAALVVTRAWCRYLCPWGLVMGFLHRASRLKIARRDERCVSCAKCVEACEVGAMEPERIRHEHCQFCYACVDACERGALHVVDVWKADGVRQQTALAQAGSQDAARRPGPEHAAAAQRCCRR